MQFQMKVTNLLGDACKLPLKTGSIDLIVTHPPYIGIDVSRYGGDPKSQLNFSQDEKKMMKLLIKAVQEMYRVLSNNGSLIIANNNRNGFDSKFLAMVLKETDFQFQSYYVQVSPPEEGEQKDKLIIWQHLYKGNTPFFDFMSEKRFGGPVINAPVNNMESEIDIQLDKEGFHVLDVMNESIPEKFIKIFTFPDSTVLDPFGGSGLVAVTAAKLGRIGITNDISETQHKAAARRIELSK